MMLVLLDSCKFCLCRFFLRFLIIVVLHVLVCYVLARVLGIYLLIKIINCPTVCLLFHSVGFLVGFVLSSILMSVVGSAVNTVIVCFAESPAEFEENHPQLSAEMRSAWRSGWPVECANY